MYVNLAINWYIIWGKYNSRSWFTKAWTQINKNHNSANSSNSFPVKIKVKKSFEWKNIDVTCLCITTYI